MACHSTKSCRLSTICIPREPERPTLPRWPTQICPDRLHPRCLSARPAGCRWHVTLRSLADSVPFVSRASQRDLRCRAGRLRSVQTDYIPSALVPGLQVADGMSLYEVLQTQYHLYPARARETYVAALADSSTAQLLGIPVGSPVFGVERVTFTLNERPFEFVQSTVRGDRYSIVLDLVKNAGEQQALTLNS